MVSKSRLCLSHYNLFLRSGTESHKATDRKTCFMFFNSASVLFLHNTFFTTVVFHIPYKRVGGHIYCVWLCPGTVEMMTRTATAAKKIEEIMVQDWRRQILFCWKTWRILTAWQRGSVTATVRTGLLLWQGVKGKHGDELSALVKTAYAILTAETVTCEYV